MLDPIATVDARCKDVRLEGDARVNVRETIRLSQAGTALVAPTLASPSNRGAKSRELPRISVDLRGTLSQADAVAVPTPGAERDLEIVRSLGEGGMGRVLLARQHSLDRDVAIKTVKDSGSDRERSALLAEGAILGHLEHPAVVPVHALGIDDAGRPALVMKNVEGAAWSELLANPEHPAWAGRGGDADDRRDAHLEILMQVCNAAHYAHSRGIVHRDIKPANVLLGRFGEVYLADWGVAHRLEAPQKALPLCGTPAYMAPEMVSGGPIDVRTDVYLIGATLHEILVGAPRHDAPTIRATLLAALASEPVDYPPSVPAPLARLANAATSAEPSARPATAAEVRDALAAYKRHASSIALAASAAARIAKLRNLVEDGAALGDEARLREIDVVAAEARFAIGEALRAWGDNAEALEAKRALDALLESRRARSAELERLARELDPGVSSGARMVTFAALAVSGLALSVFGLVVDRRDVSTTELLCESLAPLALVVLSAAILRRRLSKNAINRRAIAALVVALATISANRAVALVLAVPAAHVVVFDLLAMAMASAVGAVFAFRWLTLTAVGLFATAFVAAALPESTVRVFSAGTGLMLLSTLFLAWRSQRR